MKTRIGLSGATSFTGVWIARALAAAGFEVHGLCTADSASAYSGLKRTRHDELAKAATIHYGIRVETGATTNWITRHRPDYWVHHHHFMDDFRAPHYDLARAREIGIQPLGNLLGALKQAETKGILFSGSYFEPGEGGQRVAYRPTPYAQSKAETWLELQRLTKTLELPLKKIVIPNPIGPLENEDRLIPILLRSAAEGKAFTLGAPDAIADNLSVLYLAEVYVQALKDFAGGARILRPSMGGQNNLDLVTRVNRDLIQIRLRARPAQVEIPGGERPLTRFLNSEVHAQDWDFLWNRYAEFAQVYAKGLAKS